jgi:radical SAM superfamily enzyme YgiQ (UPF0313 family)
MKITLVCHKYNVPLDDPCCYPLGFMYVSSALKAFGHEVKVLNYNLFDYDLEKEIDGQDQVMFTGFEEFLPFIKRDAAICKRKGIFTVVGGALATFAPELMKTIVDDVFKGEFCNNYLPDYEGFGIEEYHNRHKIRYMGVLTSFGCPFSCTFCAHICRYRQRKIEDVLDEIDIYVDKYKIEYIVFNDNTINVDKHRVHHICNAMKERGLKWSASLRTDQFDESLCKAMKESNCAGVIVGVESFNQKRLDLMKKKVTVEQITTCLDLLHKYDIPYYGNVLYGFNGQSMKEIREDQLKVPPQYNLFPALVKPFVGTKEGNDRKISKEDQDSLSKRFSSFIESKGMYTYPELDDDNKVSVSSML